MELGAQKLKRNAEQVFTSLQQCSRHCPGGTGAQMTGTFHVSLSQASELFSIAHSRPSSLARKADRNRTADTHASNAAHAGGAAVGRPAGLCAGRACEASLRCALQPPGLIVIPAGGENLSRS